MLDSLDKIRMLDNAACASQNDFDDVTRQAIRMNIIDPLCDHIIRLESLLQLIERDPACANERSMQYLISQALDS